MIKKASYTARRLLLLRHAKSAWPEGVADHERPLSDRGRKAAPVIGAYMAREKLVPDLALISPARRAQETWALVRDALPDAVAEREAPGIYEVPAENILAVIRSAEPHVHCLLLAGHNPGMEDVAALLAAKGDVDGLGRMTEKFPTAGLAVIDFDLDDWSDIVPGGGFLERFVTPRFLG